MAGSSRATRLTADGFTIAKVFDINANSSGDLLARFSQLELLLAFSPKADFVANEHIPGCRTQELTSNFNVERH